MQTVSRPYTFDRVVRLLIAGGGIVLAVWLINILKSVLLPFLVAWLIAYMLEPFVQYNMRLLNTRKRLLPIMMTLFEVLLVLVAMSVFILPSVGKRGSSGGDIHNRLCRQGYADSFCARCPA